MPRTAEPSSTRQQHVVLTEADAGRRLDHILTTHVPDLSRSQAQKLIQTGHVHLSEGRPKPALIVWSGLEVDVDMPAPAAATLAAEAIALTVLHDDEAIAVVDKPAGMVVHPAAGIGAARSSMLLHRLDGLSGIGGAARPGIVHRLDRGTSGVMVVAKTDAAHRALAKQFHDRVVTKEYVALVWGTMRAGETLSAPLGRDPRDRKNVESRAQGPHGRDARPEHRAARRRVAGAPDDQDRPHAPDSRASERSRHAVVGDALYGGERRACRRGWPRCRNSRGRSCTRRSSPLRIRRWACRVVRCAAGGDLEQVLKTLRRASGKELEIEARWRS